MYRKYGLGDMASKESALLENYGNLWVFWSLMKSFESCNDLIKLMIIMKYFGFCLGGGTKL